MVVLGNPPYSVSSQNKGKWISELIEDYKKDLEEKKLNLDDDFIKFIRFAQWRIEQTGYGILAFISNHVYLDGVTHRRMRESLMKTFDDIYIFDLHGNSKKKEKSPDGSKDENVFDIQQGVAISILVKKPTGKHACIVRHAELWGLRATKYSTLNEIEIPTTTWKELEEINRESCLGKFYFFTPKAFDNIDEYCEGWSIKDIFMVEQNGVKTDRDELFFDLDRRVLDERVRLFYSEGGLSQSFREKYRVEDSSSYKILSRRLNTSFDESNIHQCLYRPFDARWLYYDPNLTSRAAWEVMRHVLSGHNIGLVAPRQITSLDFGHVLCTRLLTEIKLCSHDRASGLFPLYLEGSTQNLFDDAPGGRRPNLAPEFVEDFASRLKMSFIADGKGDCVKTFGPEDVFDYMYAVFHSPAYRSRYAEFLKIDFPRLPLTSNAELFRALCGLGARLVALHLMEEHAPPLADFPAPGSNIVEAVRYTAPGEQGSERGRVWINREQYFDGVPPEVWGFHVGGYQVANKWLKDRKGRELSYDDLAHYRRILAALAETISLMSEVDAAIEEHGDWPIQ